MSLINLQKIIKRYILHIVTFSFLLLFACARMSSPTGGVKDTDPPVPIKSKPVNYSTNFSDDKIVVEFDEFFVLKNVRQELLVSPPVPEKPEIKQRGKNLIVKINNELEDSTTYNFNFYNSIVDLNEGNPLNNFQFEFSTGSHFDSIYLGGIIHDAYNFATETKWYVMLYEKFNDTIPRTTLPNYVAKTDENGNFFVTNMKDKPYYIFGLIDMNNNMLFDLPNEKIAFLDTTFSPSFKEVIHIDTLQIIDSISYNLKDTIFVDTIITHKDMVTTIDDIRLYLFVEDFELQYFNQTYRPERQQVVFSFNRELNDSISVIPINNNGYNEEWYVQEMFETNDSLVYWITDSLLYNIDSLDFQINYTMKDSNMNDFIKTDTIQFIYITPEENEPDKKKKGGGKFKLDFLDTKNDDVVEEDSIIIPSELTFTHNTKSPFNLNKEIEITSRFPLETIDSKQIELLRIEDDTVKIPIKFSLYKSETKLLKYIIEFEKDEEESFELLIPEGAISDIYNNINDTLLYKFKTHPYSYYSTIYMNIEGVKENSIVQITDSKEKVLEERLIFSDTTIIFEYIAPSKYLFKLYYDSNNNGKWDTGNFGKLLQPEKVFYYPFFPELLEIKSNTDIENVWELYPVPDSTHTH